MDSGLNGQKGSTELHLRLEGGNWEPLIFGAPYSIILQYDPYHLLTVGRFANGTVADLARTEGKVQKILCRGEDYV